MLDHVVLFLWFRENCEVTADHLARLRLIEGADRVIPLDVSGEDRTGAVDYGPYASDVCWQRADAAIYRWARSGAFVPAARYLIAEWDVLATMPLREWWGEACYDADFGVVSSTRPGEPWDWWDHLDRLPAPLRPHAAGFCPFGFQVLSRRAFQALADAEPAPGIFCELRQATYLRAMGYNAIVRGRHGPGDVWCRDVVAGTGKGVWHPIKQLTPAG